MMNELTGPITGLLEQLQNLAASLTEEQYCERLRVLSNASLGQHIRHIIEFFIELNKGYESGLVNYDRRERDYEIETGRSFAILKLREITGSLGKKDRQLMLEADFGAAKELPCRTKTNYRRELVYNLEHMVHHMALLRIGVGALSEIALADSFGVAASTLKFRNACAQ
jgi:hypothetical protein